ncbi:MAG: ABC transporter permease [Treponemataceae bacterium]|nr:ABC transporter permease [Treponemataceae bacterium]
MKSLYLNFAVKSLLNRARQYRSLFAVSAIGMCIMVSVLMITDGMLNSMTEKMRQYYGGDFMILGGEKYYDEIYSGYPLEKLQEMIGALKEVLPKNAQVSARITKTDGDKSFFFEGVGVKQRTLHGVDFESEHALFQKFTFIEGNADARADGDGAVISLPVAQKLGVHVGDEVILFFEEGSLKNTVSLVVTGIFQDSSVFGMYTSYIDYKALLEVLSIKVNLTDKICVYYPNGSPSDGEIRRVQNELEKRFDMFPLSYNKKDWKNYERGDDDVVYALIPLSANISELQTLSSALHAIVALIVAMLVIIISVGISSTFRVIVMKRAVESGTFRALGMKPSGLMLLYFTEVFVLLASGCAIGFALSLVVTKIVSGFNLSFISGFDLFLMGGRLAPSFCGGKMIFLTAIIFVTTLGAVLFTLRKLIHISPVGALSTVT